MKQTVILAPRLFDGVETVVDGGAAVVIENGAIAYAGARASMPSAEGAEIVEFADATILPGLIDAHVHLTMDGSADPVSKTRTDPVPIATMRALHSAENHILRGVTTVRDCGSQAYIAVHLAEAVRSGWVTRAPRILACGPVICITGGHGSFVGIEADGADAVRQAARTVLKNGADFIKVIATGGVLTKGTNAVAAQMEADELAAAVAVARHAGVRTTTHAHANAGIRLALQAGIDSIDHASYIDDETIDMFRKTGACYVPTLISSVCQMEHLDEIPAYIAEKIQKHIGHELDSVNRLIAAGIPLAGATDGGTPFNSHGNLPKQLALLHRHGLSRLEALRAGSHGSARVMGIDGLTGRLVHSLAADVLVVQGNPLDDLDCLQDVRAVWRDGMRLV